MLMVCDGELAHPSLLLPIDLVPAFDSFADDIVAELIAKSFFLIFR